MLGSQKEFMQSIKTRNMPILYERALKTPNTEDCNNYMQDLEKQAKLLNSNFT